jgi:hypothetical protein
MDNYNNRMYQDKYIRNLIGKIAFGIIVFLSLSNCSNRSIMNVI